MRRVKEVNPQGRPNKVKSEGRKELHDLLIGQGGVTEANYKERR